MAARSPGVRSAHGQDPVDTFVASLHRREIVRKVGRYKRDWRRGDQGEEVMIYAQESNSTLCVSA